MTTLQKFTFTFLGQSPTQLKSDPFLGRHILQHAPDFIFREAERWSHPWRFLLGVRDLPSACYDLFRAAESVSRAMHRVQHMLWGGATLQRDLPETMVGKHREGDKAGATKLGKKLIRQLIKYGLWEGNNLPQMPQPTRTQIKSWEAEARRALVRKGLREKAELMVTDKILDPVGYLLISNWLRWGQFGEPGLCYYSDEALADLILLLSGEQERYGLHTRTEYYRKFRQRLLLEQACYRKPLVTKARPVPNSGLIEIKMHFKEGTDSHQLTSHQALVIGGRKYYPRPV